MKEQSSRSEKEAHRGNVLRAADGALDRIPDKELQEFQLSDEDAKVYQAMAESLSKDSGNSELGWC